MKRLSIAEYQALICGGNVLAHDTYGAKVIEISDGRIVKLFRTKRLLSAAQWNPYAERFFKNAKLLTKLGVATVAVSGVYRVPEIQRDIVVYGRLAGESLRDVVSGDPGDQAHDVLSRFASFLASLHGQGVLFRSIHFGNVLVINEEKLGLIDVADMRKHCFGALTLKQRARNFRHMLRYSEDRSALHRFGAERFIAQYAQGETLNQRSSLYLQAALKDLLSDRAS